MREYSESPSLPDLTGSLLLAHPSLIDPNFRRSVVFITTHDPEEGSHGFIINRPTGNTVADLLPGREMGVLATLPVFAGGPVGRDQLTFAAFVGPAGGKIVECTPHLEIEEAQELAKNGPSSVRAFVGYSGWSKGQIEMEMAQKAWITAEADRDFLDTEKCKELWASVMRGLGPWYRLLSIAPDDPSMN